MIAIQEVFHDKFIEGQAFLEIFHDEGVLNEEISTQIVSSLNEICPYIDQVVLIGGMALVPEIDLEEIEVSEESWRYSVASGYHRGVGF